MIGDMWLSYKSDEAKRRAYCGRCETLESMEHILLECEYPGQEVLWKEAGKLWTRRGKEWKRPNLGTILGCGLLNAGRRDEIEDGPSRRTKENKQDGRLLKILLSETARAIWAFRCKRVIDPGDLDFTEKEAIARWRARLNNRIHTDRCLTDQRKYPKRALDTSLVRDTWAHLIADEKNYDWIKYGGVLVGSEPRPIDTTRPTVWGDWEVDEWEDLEAEEEVVREDGRRWLRDRGCEEHSRVEEDHG
jgi:hypothetical protein